MIIDLTCYPTGEVAGDKNTTAIALVEQRIREVAPTDWPPLKLIVAEGQIRAADFPSAVILFVFVKGGDALPDMPKLQELADGWLTWGGFIIRWDTEAKRLHITEAGNGDTCVS